MKLSKFRNCIAGAATVLALLAGCSGSGGAAPASSAGGSTPQAIQGIATPSSVAVVTATN